jgi:hypothetical protein
MKITDKFKVQFWRRTHTNQFLNQIDEYVAWKRLFANSTDQYENVLIDFLIQTGRESISHVSREDVNNYRHRLSVETTPYQTLKYLHDIRGLFRYYGARKVMCLSANVITEEGISPVLSVNDIMRNMARTLSSEEKKKRNEDLVRKRIQDPLKWTYRELAKEFDLARSTSQQMFMRHVMKYASQEEFRNYQKIINETYVSG